MTCTSRDEVVASSCHVNLCDVIITQTPILAKFAFSVMFFILPLAHTARLEGQLKNK